MEWIQLGVSFILGIISSIIAALVFPLIETMRLKQSVSIEENWGEYVPASINHQFSLGRIYYDQRRRLYAFDGTNYRNDGEKYCHWQTVTSYLDISSRKYFYTFTAQIEGELGVTYYGFGVVNLGSDGKGKLVPVDAHYISADIDGAPMSHSMVRMQDIPYSRSNRGDRVIKVLIAAEPIQ